MIIMALDHARDYFHITAMTADPTNPATTTPILFFTRWITHFCAPVFVLLAGISAYLAGRKKSKKELSVYLLSRGLWLIVLELVFFNLIFTFDPGYHFLGMQVLWVTGASMMLLAGLIYLPVKILMGIGLLLVAGHNLLDTLNVSPGNPMPFWWGFLHQQYFVAYAPGHLLGVLYPLLPWPGIMLLGFGMGSLYTREYDAQKRRKLLLAAGWSAIGVFFVLRWINSYGDLFPWVDQKNPTATLLSFFNLTKYPPSFLFNCMTLGPALVILAWLEKAKAGWGKVVVIYGRVPLYYYLLHFFIIHCLCMLAFFATGHSMEEIAGGIIYFRPSDFGFPLWTVYLIWISVVAIMFPLCKKYGAYKALKDYWWLKYL